MANSTQTRTNNRAAQILLVTGIVPLTVMTLWLVAIGEDHSLHDATVFSLKAYAAVALSFLGGNRSGVALFEDGARTRTGIFLGSLPPLAGWIALVLPDAYGFAILAVAFAGLGAMDQLGSLHSPIPPRLGQARFYLTVLAVVSMIAAFAVTADSIVLS